MPLQSPTFDSPDRDDRALLHEHLLQCDFARGPLYRCRCAIESAHRFLAPRFVTTLAVTITAVVLLSASLPS